MNDCTCAVIDMGFGPRLLISQNPVCKEHSMCFPPVSPQKKENKMTDLKITEENLMNAYKNGCADVKKTLEAMFPEQFKKKGRIVEQWYFFINQEGCVLQTKDCAPSDQKRFELGNYFHTREQAEQVLNGLHGSVWYFSVTSLREYFNALQRHFGIID